MSSKNSKYPFIPKSALSLTVGQFWALPLSDGSFGCACVIQLMPKEMIGSRVSFLAGVLDWHGKELPSAESIAHSPCLDQGAVHLKAITETGGVIIGSISLEDAGIEPWIFRDADGWINSDLVKGFITIRPQTPDDSQFPVFSSWGFKTPLIIAESRFINNG